MCEYIFVIVSAVTVQPRVYFSEKIDFLLKKFLYCVCSYSQRYILKRACMNCDVCALSPIEATLSCWVTMVFVVPSQRGCVN